MIILDAFKYKLDLPVTIKGQQDAPLYRKDLDCILKQLK